MECTPVFYLARPPIYIYKTTLKHSNVSYYFKYIVTGPVDSIFSFLAGLRRPPPKWHSTAHSGHRIKIRVCKNTKIILYLVSIGLLG